MNKRIVNKIMYLIQIYKILHLHMILHAILLMNKISEIYNP